MNIKFKNYESIFFRKILDYLQFLKLVYGLEKKVSFEYVINSQHYSFKNRTLTNVKFLNLTIINFWRGSMLKM